MRKNMQKTQSQYSGQPVWRVTAANPANNALVEYTVVGTPGACAVAYKLSASLWFMMGDLNDQQAVAKANELVKMKIIGYL